MARCSSGTKSTVINRWPRPTIVDGHGREIIDLVVESDEAIGIDEEGTVITWPRSGTTPDVQLFATDGHSRLAYLTKEQLILTAGCDAVDRCTMAFWDRETGESLVEFGLEEYVLADLAVNDTWLHIVDRKGRYTQLNFATTVLQDAACAVAGRNFIYDDWKLVFPAATIEEYRLNLTCNEWPLHISFAEHELDEAYGELRECSLAGSTAGRETLEFAIELDEENVLQLDLLEEVVYTLLDQQWANTSRDSNDRRCLDEVNRLLELERDEPLDPAKWLAFIGELEALNGLISDSDYSAVRSRMSQLDIPGATGAVKHWATVKAAGIALDTCTFSYPDEDPEFCRHWLDLTKPENVLDIGNAVQSQTNREPLWMFDGKEDQRVVLSLDDLNEGTFDPYLTLFDATGRIFATDDDSGGGHDGYNALLAGEPLPATGRYYIYAGRRNSSARYELTLREQVISSLPLNHTVTSTTEEQSLWEFSGLAGQWLQISMATDDGSFDPELTLYDPNGDRIDYDDDSGNRWNARIETSLPETGVYTLEAGRAGSDALYRLTMTEPTLYQLISGQTVTSTTAEKPLWHFSGQAGQGIRITMETGDGNFDQELTLYTPNGNQVTKDDNLVGRGAFIETALPYDGMYTLQVRRSDSHALYTLTMTQLMIPQLPFDQPIRSTTANNTLWQFAGRQGQGIRVVMETDESDFALLLSLDAPDGEEVARSYNSDGMSTSIEVRIPISGVYSVHVGDADNSGPYTLTVSPFDVPILSLGENITSTTSDHTVWLFEGEANQDVRISMETADERFDPLLTLLDSEGNVLAENDDTEGRNAQITTKLPDKGIYTIRAGRNNSRAVYTLTVSAYEMPTLALNELVESSTVTEHLWAFELSEAQTVRIAFDSVDGTFDPYLTLKDEADRVIAEDDDSGVDYNALIENIQLEAGRYIIELRGSGAFRLLAETVP